MTDDLFSYPDNPGWKVQETSRLAAEAVKPSAPILRARCLEAIKAAGHLGLTGNELAEKIGHDVMSVRPRVSELLRMHKVHNSGTRRATGSGCTAIVWRAGPDPQVDAVAA